MEMAKVVEKVYKLYEDSVQLLISACTTIINSMMTD